MNFDVFSLPYPIVIRSSVFPDGTACFVAEHPDLPGCAVDAVTIEEARALLSGARVAYLRYLISKGRNPPMPLPYRQREWQIGTVGSMPSAPRPVSAMHWKLGDRTNTPTMGVPVHA